MRGISYIRLMRTGQVSRTLRDSAGWWTTLFAGAVIALPVALAETAIWHTLDTDTGPFAAVIIIIAASVVLAISAGAFLGRIRLPGKMTIYRLTYPMRMTPWKARELLARGHPGNGRRSPRYPTEAEFIAADERRRPGFAGGGTQCDFGVWWRGPGGGHRLTWIKDTGELVAIAPGCGRGEEGAVEIIARIPSEAETEHRLRDWPYATHDLRWVRRRAHGWNVLWVPETRATWADSLRNAVAWSGAWRRPEVG